MVQLTVHIPESELGFYLELFRQLGVEASDDFAIPEDHKEVVRQRQKRVDEDAFQLVQWEDIQDKFALD